MIAGAAIAVGLAQALALQLAAPGPACPPAVAGPPPPVLLERAVMIEPAPEPERVVLRGVCPLGLLPAGMVQPVTDAEAAELPALVTRWISRAESWQPPIGYRRGVVYVESEEDRGDDPPYPRSAAPEAERVCSSAADWLRSHLQDRLTRVDGLRCDGNVCCYDGMEYSPDGLVVFRRGESDWDLDAWIQIHQAALSAEIVEENSGFVRGGLQRLSTTRCPGEPDGHE